MFPDRGARGLALITGLTFGLFATVLRAGEPPKDEALAKFGLRLAGTVAVLEGESKAHDLVNEARQLEKQRHIAIMRQRSTVSEKDYKATVQQLDQQVKQLQTQLQNTSKMMSRIPKFSRRGMRGFYNSNMKAQYNELNMMKGQIQWELNQRKAFSQRLKSRPYDPREKLKADSEARNKDEALHQVVLDLRQTVDELSEQYKKLAQDPALKTALKALGQKEGHTVTLGPSVQLHKDMKLLSTVEHKLAMGPTEGAAIAKPARKGRSRSSGRRRSTRSPANAGAAGSPF